MKIDPNDVLQEIDTRIGTFDDLNFVFATWLRSYRHDSAFARSISNDIYYHWHHKIIENAIRRGAYIVIAHPKDSPEVIVGYACVEGSTLHYVYVKKAFREMGIARTLLKHAPFKEYTHITENGKLILDLCPGIIYNPYLL
jgi:GNAT superfamily N-acetyltransferase